MKNIFVGFHNVSKQNKVKTQNNVEVPVLPLKTTKKYAFKGVFMKKRDQVRLQLVLLCFLTVTFYFTQIRTKESYKKKIGPQ